MALRGLSFACLTSLCMAAAVSAAEDLAHKGMEFYKQKDFKQAVVFLGKATRKDPYNAELHYYLANSHIFLKDGNSAIREYSACFDLDPLGTFGQYSRKALLGFGKKFQGLATAAAEPAGKHRIAADDAKSIKQAVALIAAQSCEREKLNHAAGEDSAKVSVSAGEDKQRRLSKAAEDLLADLSQANRSPSPALQEEMHEIQQSAVFAGQHARHDAQQQAAMHMSEAVKRSTAVEKSASSLLALMSEAPRRGKVKMKAAGTNLYVRNYDFEPEPPPEPLLATWELLPSVALPGSSSKIPHSILSHSSSKAKSHEKAPSLRLELKPAKANANISEINGRILLHVRDNGPK
ncbi:MAG: hypothetical protein K2X81_26460 [Candidatus Obscuribacterales bacterium]|nr:hypothetical protein [Candidatus Obscuribacterales bacterium]